MAILITGGAGYIGSHTSIELLAEGLEVIIVDDYSNSYPEVVKRIETLSGHPVKVYPYNILDTDSLASVFEENDIESVIHFAAFKAVGESVEKPLEYYQNNVAGLLSLLDVMSKYQVKEIVFSSSATVYGMDNQAPFNEQTPIGDATNPYGYSKIVNERILQDLAVADPEWKITLLRYFNPIGAHKSGLIGEDPQGIPNNLMPYITQVAVGKLDQLRIFGNDYPTPDGTGVRDYIHVVDLAKGHLAALKHLEKQQGVEIFNLGTGQGYSVLDLVESFQEANGVDIPYTIVERRPGDIATSYADPSKAEKVLGWTAQESLKDMCQDSWRWQKNNPQGYQDGNIGAMNV
ncbi:UDP-glucose 4-epimerase GalE [Hutsoniella sourekii]|uniref:UDP-glucose 4-epimerase GalE n=1 Tax=Hutsoniella sourekii TaxID=87650 RepID=UPI0004886F2B|nr:UDP-glucose 4-epimerase GalE [Hutsoniella sourekii]